MLVGVPREIKDNEFRVGLTPSTARELVEHGHKVIVQHGAGESIDLNDERYRAVGAEIVPDAAAVFARAELVVKVKEPQPAEIAMLRQGQILFTYLHLAPDRVQTEALLRSGCIAIAYETVTDDRGGLPLLAPMSEVAGRMSIQAGAHALEHEAGGSGIQVQGEQFVEDVEVEPPHLHHSGVGEVSSPVAPVGVAPDRVHRRNPLQGAQNPGVADIPGVDDELHAFEGFQRLGAQQPMGVGDDPDTMFSHRRRVGQAPV